MLTFISHPWKLVMWLNGELCLHNVPPAFKLSETTAGLLPPFSSGKHKSTNVNLPRAGWFIKSRAASYLVSLKLCLSRLTVLKVICCTGVKVLCWKVLFQPPSSVQLVFNPQAQLYSSQIILLTNINFCLLPWPQRLSTVLCMPTCGSWSLFHLEWNHLALSFAIPGIFGKLLIFLYLCPSVKWGW